MEQIHQSVSQSGQSGTVQGQNVPQLRNEHTQHVQSQMGRFDTNGQPGQISDPLSLAAEAERQARDEISAGQSASLRFTGRAARNDQSARLFARYDPKQRTVQPQEFYRFACREIDTHGYI